MLGAMEDVYSDTVGVNEAAQIPDVPPTMLKNRISGRVKRQVEEKQPTEFTESDLQCS